MTVTETATNSNTFSVSCDGGACGTVTLVSGSFALATNGEGFYAYADTDGNPHNGVTEIYSVLYAGDSFSPGGNIPATENPAVIYTGAIVTDGFPTNTSPGRTEFNPANRVNLVDQAALENNTNYLYGQSNTSLSTTSFSNMQGCLGLAICQDITVALDANGNASITASSVDGGSPAGTTLSIDQSSFDCSNLGTNPVVLTATLGNDVDSETCMVTIEDNTPGNITIHKANR